MAKKTAKQEFLDTAKPDGIDHVTTLLLNNYTKTKLSKMGRELKEIHDKVTYKTHMREIPFGEIYKAVERAYKLMLTEKEDANV